ncbi:CDP-alcohol phosphatidyltransferase family protein [Candidatus Uhrbacteria bacterium]|nr:CDP-alcohol phosphatidyltransferase family protein [Candidatus Uhrbacteria bacterium]
MIPRNLDHVKMMTNETIVLFPHDYVLKWTLIPLIPTWVKPNHITAFRFIATPVVLALLLFENYPWGVPAFIFVAGTDALDGSLARLRKQITLWGTFYDPLADKILIGSVVLLVVLQHINVWFGLLIVVVELMIAAGGLYRKVKGRPIIAANIFGKTKMALQVIAVSLLLIALWSGVDLFIPFSIGTFALALAFAIISLWTYGL